MRFFEFFDQQLDEAPLGTTGLFKYQGTKKDRVPIFLQKIKAGTPFKVKTKTGVEDVIINPTEYDHAADWIQNPTKNFKLKTVDGRILPFGDIIKTKEFGGKDAFHGEKIEQGQIGEIQSQLEDKKAGKTSLKLKVGDSYVAAATVEKEKGSVRGRAPKSDMTVLDENGTPVAWVSLKGDPFRWGGWQHLIDVPEIASWMNKVRQVNNGVFEPGMSFGLRISDNLANKIVFGKEFGGAPGFSNVNAVLIGDVSISNGKLTATRVYTNGQTPTGGDKPYIVMRYTQGRNDFGFQNVRAETNTASEGRKVKWLDSDADVESAKKMFSDEAAHKASIAGLNPKQRAAANKEFKVKRQALTPTNDTSLV